MNMDEVRANPDELLKAIKQEESSETRGHLKIYFGYAAGVGKTYAMLKAAHTAKRQGIDVVVGYVEPHARPQTAALLEDLETIPQKKVKYNGIELCEFDIDEALKRKPKLILVDELAHTNAEGCRHTKRYQDVEELLKAGIDVYTTVNVQHIESLCDQVATITGVLVRERIPDRVFENSDQVKLVDVEPQELIERLGEGKIYREAQSKKALENFFSLENLTALREIALRCCADRMNKLSDTARAKSNSDYYTDEHILVCLSPSPTNLKIIRTAARLAKAFKGSFTALFVETSEFAGMSEEDKDRLRSNIRLATQLGATIETAYGDDIAYQISEFARLSGVSKVVLGRSNTRRKYFFSKASLTEKLIIYSPNLDVYVIPDREPPAYIKRRLKSEKEPFRPIDLLSSFLILVVSTLISFGFYALGFSEANIITIYILGVLLTAVITSHRAYSLTSSVISVLVFNFFFTEPRFSLNAYDSGYPSTFLIMFLAAFITGTLAVKIKQSAKKSAQTAYRTKILLDTNQLLQQARVKNSIIEVTANQIIKLLGRDVVFFPVENNFLAPTPFVFAKDKTEPLSAEVNESERAVAIWVYKNNKHAGATTNTLSNAQYLYLAVRVNSKVYGVVGIYAAQMPIESFENSIMLSILGECALALENEQIAEEKERNAILAKNEQLRADLLRAISHDLRTPLTSISGNADTLLSSEASLTAEKRKQLYGDIYDDSLWLINLVENLLSVTRIEDGSMSLRQNPELLDDVITEALHHINRKSVEHEMSINISDEFVLVKMDARLIVQVIINIVDNAIKYTPKGSKISISAFRKNHMAIVEIADDGPGINDEAKLRIFDMFYTANATVADSRRSLGLGLALCKSIINAHGGEIVVLDNKPNGTKFRFELPIQEVTINE